MQPFILLFPLLFPKKGRLPLYQVVDSFRPAMARAYKLAQVNMAYRRKLYSMSVNVSCFILPAPPLFCWYYYTIFRARMEVGIIQRSGENFFSSVCLTGSGSSGSFILLLYIFCYISLPSTFYGFGLLSCAAADLPQRNVSARMTTVAIIGKASRPHHTAFTAIWYTSPCTGGACMPAK